MLTSLAHLRARHHLAKRRIERVRRGELPLRVRKPAAVVHCRHLLPALLAPMDRSYLRVAAPAVGRVEPTACAIGGVVAMPIDAARRRLCPRAVERGLKCVSYRVREEILDRGDGRVHSGDDDHLNRSGNIHRGKTIAINNDVAIAISMFATATPNDDINYNPNHNNNNRRSSTDAILKRTGRGRIVVDSMARMPRATRSTQSLISQGR